MTKNIFSWLLFSVFGIIGSPAFLLLRLSGRVIVRGKDNIPKGRLKNVLFVSNHPSFLETVLIPFAAFWPKGIINPLSYVPWQTPDKRIVDNFPLLNLLRCIPVGNVFGFRKDPSVYRRLKKLLPDNALLIFAEGGRSGKAKHREGILYYTNQGNIPIGKPEPGVGALIRYGAPLIIPVLVRGAEKVLPIGTAIPNFTKSKVEIIFGSPYKFQKSPPEEFQGKNRELHQWFADQAMLSVAKLDDET